MEEIGNFIIETIENINDDKKLSEIKERVKELCLKFPLYE